MHFIAADPDEAGRTDSPSPEDYTGHEDWDGVAELRADLRSLTARQAELRLGAGVRYWSWIGGRALRRAEDELQRLDQVVDEARRGEEVPALLLEELDDIDVSARATLREAIYDELMAGVTDDSARQRAEVEDRLNGTISAWLAQWSAKLDGLARRAATEQRVRAERPGARALQAYLDELFAGDLPPITSRRPSVDDLLKRLDGHARTVARAGYKLFHGMSAEEARAELAHLRYLRADQLEQHFASTEGLLTSAEHSQRHPHQPSAAGGGRGGPPGRGGADQLCRRRDAGPAGRPAPRGAASTAPPQGRPDRTGDRRRGRWCAHLVRRRRRTPRGADRRRRPATSPPPSRNAEQTLTASSHN